MSTRSLSARRSGLTLAALACALVSLAPAGATAKTVTAELRVLTPTKVLDPGTTYVVGNQSVRTDPKADCLGAGGSGSVFDIPDPTGLGLLAAGADARRSLRPLSVSDGSGFGIAICGVGSAEATQDTFWYFKRNHQELTVGADQEPIKNGDELLAYLSPNNFPNPNPTELELRAPARAATGQPFEVMVIAHSCVSDPNPPYATTCSAQPAAGVTISGAGAPASTGADGTATLSATEPLTLGLVASRAPDIPSRVALVCVADEVTSCPATRGERIVGTRRGDRIRGTKGADSIRSGGGKDVIDLRRGGPDRVTCGTGKDLVRLRRADRDDRIAHDCERVRRR